MMKNIVILFVFLLMAGCVQIPPNTFVTTPELLQQRQLETRRYDDIKEADLITASANVLQDLGSGRGRRRLGRNAGTGARLAAAGRGVGTTGPCRP